VRSLMTARPTRIARERRCQWYVPVQRFGMIRDKPTGGCRQPLEMGTNIRFKAQSRSPKRNYKLGVC
jgi:hypothetical protein